MVLTKVSKFKKTTTRTLRCSAMPEPAKLHAIKKVILVHVDKNVKCAIRFA